MGLTNPIKFLKAILGERSFSQLHSHVDIWEMNSKGSIIDLSIYVSFPFSLEQNPMIPEFAPRWKRVKMKVIRGFLKIEGF